MRTLDAMRLALLLLSLLPSLGMAQPLPGPPEPARSAGWGAAMVLTNYGFGVSGALRHDLGPTTALVGEAAFTAGRDEREQAFFSSPFGETVVPFKRHRFVMLPATVGVEQRLWARTIEPSFRPFVHAAAGPVLGFQWPYFEDENGNGIRDVGESLRSALDFSGGELRVGVSGLIGLGAHLEAGRRQLVSVRAGVAVQAFTEPVELLEPRVGIERPERRVFATPVLSLHLVWLRR